MSLRVARTSFKKMFEVESLIKAKMVDAEHLDTEREILQCFYSDQRLILEKTLKPGEAISTNALDVILLDFGYDNATKQLEDLSNNIRSIYSEAIQLRREAKQLKRRGTQAFSQLRLHQRRKFLKSKFLNGGTVWE